MERLVSSLLEFLENEFKCKVSIEFHPQGGGHVLEFKEFDGLSQAFTRE